MIEKAFDVIAAKAQAGSTIFLLGAYTKAKRGFGAGRRPAAFNAMCMDYCNRHPESFRYIDTDALVPLDQAIGNHHFTRAGYHLVARHMLQQTDRHTASKVAAQ
jgi:hypothetical protein